MDNLLPMMSLTVAQAPKPRETTMKTIALTTFAAATLLVSAASAAPLLPATAGAQPGSNVDQVRLVCDEDGHCWQSRGPRYIQRSYGDDDAYVVRRSYGPGYYERPGYGYYGGPGISFSFGSRGW
jgi:hypothetical protein